MPGKFQFFAAAILLSTIFCPWTTAEPVQGGTIRMLGLEARLNPEIRDIRLQEIAAYLNAMSPERAHELQGDFQYALLLHCDPEIYDTLSETTIEAIDNSLETLFSLEDIDRDNHWEPLIYVYGFFNRDVTLEIIQEVIARWDGLSDEEKGPRYPTYIHVIDAVCKPLAMGALRDTDQTRAALELVIPAMKTAFVAAPKPGTAFPPPSHACLVLGPLYERWANDPEFGPFIEAQLGSRTAFEAMMISQLPGGLKNNSPLSHVDYGFHAYIGSYLANAIARLDARTALPALERSMAIYEKHKAKGRVLEYTQRARLALGDAGARADFDAALKDPTQKDACVKTASWLARNGKGETRAYGLNALGALLDSTPDKALDVYFEKELAGLAN